MLSHTGQLPYACQHPNCTQRFAKKCLMIAHYSALHSNYCFPVPDFNRSHKRTISQQDDVVYKCTHSKCSKTFPNESQLRAHIIVHNPGMAAENAFLLSSLHRVMNCVETSDKSIKEQVYILHLRSFQYR